MAATTVECGRCGQQFDSLPTDEHGPIVRLVEHWKRRHESGLVCSLFSGFLHSVGYGPLDEGEVA